MLAFKPFKSFNTFKSFNMFKTPKSFQKSFLKTPTNTIHVRMFSNTENLSNLTSLEFQSLKKDINQVEERVRNVENVFVDQKELSSNFNATVYEDLIRAEIDNIDRRFEQLETRLDEKQMKIDDLVDKFRQNLKIFDYRLTRVETRLDEGDLSQPKINAINDRLKKLEMPHRLSVREVLYFIGFLVVGYIVVNVIIPIAFLVFAGHTCKNIIENEKYHTTRTVTTPLGNVKTTTTEVVKK